MAPAAPSSNSSATTADPAPAASGARAWRTLWRIIAAVLAALLIGWLILFITKGRFLKQRFESIVAGSIHRRVSVAGDFQLYFDPIVIKFVARGMTISNPDWATRPYLFDAGAIDTRVETLPLLFGRRHIRWLDLLNGAVDLEWDKSGKRNNWTFDSGGGGKPFEMPLIRRATISGSTLRYRDPVRRLTADLDFRTIMAGKAANAASTHIDDAIRFSGSATALAERFTLTGALLSPNETLAGGRNRIEIHAHAAKTAIDVTGTLRAPTEIEGADLRVAARGRNLADLFSIGGIAVPETRAYRVGAALTKSGNEYRFTGLNGRFGDSDLAGTLTVVERRPRIKLIANLATKTLDIVDVAPFIGYNPDAVAARGAAAAIHQVGGTPRILPDAALRVDALKNFDADVHYSVRSVRAKSVPVSNIDLTLGLNDRLLDLAPLTFDMARGHVWSDITIDARPAVVHTDYDIRLSPTPMAVLLAGYGVDQAGTSGTVKARIRLAGDGNTVHESLSSASGRIVVIIPRGTFWTRNIQLVELDVGTFLQKLFEKKLKEPVRINCGLIGFTVRGGVAAADPILIDTEKNVITARGGFNFRNEAIDLAIRADAKRFSLFSGQSPIDINGHFAAPGVQPITPQLLGRAGLGIGLGLVATPLAGVLAFVDMGDAKGTQCGPVLAGASASAQRTIKGAPRTDVGDGSTQNGRSTKRHKILGIF